MSNTQDYVLCPCCGSKVPKGSFCPECGSPLEKVDKSDNGCKMTVPDQNTAPQIGLPDGVLNSFGPAIINGTKLIDLSHPEDIPEPESDALDDAGLTLVADFCKHTMATVGGDGYDETVLYKDEEDGSYQIHTYAKYQYMKKEAHHSYAAKDGAEEAVLALIDELKLEEYEGKTGIGLCGGMYVCKFQKDGIMHRVTTDNLGTDGAGIIMKVGSLIGNYVGEELKKITEDSAK